jgi:hypothetical protein
VNLPATFVRIRAIRESAGYQYVTLVSSAFPWPDPDNLWMILPHFEPSRLPPFGAGAADHVGARAAASRPKILLGMAAPVP